MKEIEIIGEAAGRASGALRDRAASVPWREVIGKRNGPLPVSFDIALDLLWGTVRADLPALAASGERLLARESVPPDPAGSGR